MSVRKRSWKTEKGEPREAWIAAYTDGEGARHIKTFALKREADAFLSKVKVDVASGVHVAPSKSITVNEAAAAWIRHGELEQLERATLKNYREFVTLHIGPFIGSVSLSKITAPTVRRFQDRLREEGRSTYIIKRATQALSSILSDAHELGQVGHNAVRDLSRGRKRGKERQAEKRRKGKLKVGEDIPTAQEITAIVAGAKDRWRPILITAAFTGLRASELRGLRWIDVDLEASELHVRQRADRFNAIGKPKSHAGERAVPFGTVVRNTLREWKLRCPKGELGLVFPSGSGGVESLANIINRGLKPAQGQTPTYTGMHCLRHFYASWCINRPEDGGLGLPPKVVQERLGHSTITMTMDVYGHLFPVNDDRELLDAAELRLLPRAT